MSNGQGIGFMEQIQSHHISNETGPFVSLEAEKVDLPELHRQVVRRCRRVQLVSADGSTSVLISKTELDAVEQALEILSNTHDVRSMRDELARVAALSVNPV